MNKKYIISANNTKLLVKGEYDPKPFDEKKSVLPKWLLEKGMMNYYDILETRDEIENEIKFYTKKLKRRNRSKDNRKHDLYMIKESKEELKIFSIEYFNAKDVEKAFGDLLHEYHKLVYRINSSISPRPEDIGKERYRCIKCGRRFWTKKKPKKCYGRCKGKKFERYFRCSGVKFKNKTTCI